MSHLHRPPLLRCAAGLLLVGLAAGCGGIAVDAFGRLNDAAPSADTSATADGATPATDGGVLPDRAPSSDAPPPPVDSGSAFCPAATCLAGMRCCEALRQCQPAATYCPGDSHDAGAFDAGPVDVPAGACVTASDCAVGAECVFPDSVCARSGTCAIRSECLRPETFCACTGVTYAACRPDRPTAARGPCGTPTDAGVDAGEGFCLRATCPAGSICCEAERTCAPASTGCGGTPVDAGPATCTSNAQCDARSWCDGTGCGTPGVCRLLGDTCPADASPVCGCDGRTYTNECIANLGGVRVATRGACARPDAGTVDAGPVDSGVIACRANADCPAGSYCAGDGCGTAGTCAPRPLGCTTEYNPVCGCDGRTYGNACGAMSAGVRIASRGACAVDAGVPDAGAATCITAADCRSGSECVYPTTACARSGVCATPIFCLVAVPFCACTGTTYRACRPDRPTSASGECAATPDAGTSFCATARCTATTFCCESARACIPLGSTCAASCSANADCGARQWCAGTGCGTPGTCAPFADVCPATYAPVCGCDGRTYSNECIAGAVGVRVASRGTCP